MSAQKLRGGFYTPEPLVHFCLARLRPLLRSQRELRLLEPSAGDGAFVRGVAADRSLAARTKELLAIEPQELEAEKCRRSLAATPIEGDVLAASAVDWGLAGGEMFDAAVGNPPFVRYQFISARDKGQIARLGESAGISFGGVSNLWLPVLVAALTRLREGGAFSFVVPTELLTGLSAAQLRAWLARDFRDLRIDLFAPGSFPGVLQEVAVLSGRRFGRAAAVTKLTLGEHDRRGTESSWTHTIDPEQPNWTRYLLAPAQLVAFESAISAPSVVRLGSLARFQVSVVTGANDFFCIAEKELADFGLEPWARPLLPRIRHAPGLVYSARDHAEMLRAGARGWLLDFAESAPNPRRRRGPARYLRSGEDRELPARYKCRIREPWFRVPHIERGSLFLSKRSHRYPRVIVNQAAAYTTDTIYRGELLAEAGLSPAGLSACFHSSLTLLSAELEGRSFGGGVLELVPSEIARLSIAVVGGSEKWIDRLDETARGSVEEALVEETDGALVGAGALDREVVDQLHEARLELLARRLARNERSAADEPALQRAA
ncbi:MAG: Eco57I restriction-modification methylase domain-containing protein [Solirubrobacterales bacterium]